MGNKVQAKATSVIDNQLQKALQPPNNNQQ